MTDQIERDLIDLFAQRAEETEVPPVPVDLLHAAAATGRPRRTRVLLVAAAAAAVVVAVAVPLALAARDGEEPQPAPAPTAPQVNGAPAIDVPYLHDGRLHVGALAVSTIASSIVVAGDGLLVATAPDSGAPTWERLDGDQLVAAPYLDGVSQVAVSYDGAMVAGAVDDDGVPSVRLWDAETAAVVDTVALTDPSEGDEPWLWGFDVDGRLYWQDGATQRMRTTSGSVVDIDTRGRARVGQWPQGPLLSASPEEVLLGKVLDDGTVEDVDMVAVSAVATWRGSEAVAYQGIADGAVYVHELATHQVREVVVDGASATYPLGWTGDDLVLMTDLGDVGAQVVVVDPVTGDQRPVADVHSFDDFAFPSLGGTGAL